ncbi:MAG: hypothetical protein H6585_11830 [Flavobacteriales bacterium]|nr:hypothetical protein [Flavobacteriales bacterium]MCB9449019.1 hypothetical protein [Flavobacteriales bacterium]
MKIFGIYLYKHLLSSYLFGLSCLLATFQIIQARPERETLLQIYASVIVLIMLTLALHFRVTSRVRMRNNLLMAFMYLLVAASTIYCMIL